MTVDIACSAEDRSYQGLKGTYLIVQVSDDLYEILLRRSGRKSVSSVGLAHSEKEVVGVIRGYDLD
jgi:hypothetical protein